MTPLRVLRLATVLMLALGASGCVSTSGGPEMSFRRVSFQEGVGCKGQDCASVIAAEGRVTRDTPQKFAEFVKQQGDIGPTRNVVVLSSPGGHVGGSLELGLMIRTLGSTVLVARADSTETGFVRKLYPTNCFSACAYTLMAAKTRIVPSGSEVGIHRMHSFGPGFDPVRETPTTRFLTAGKSEVDTLKRYVSAVGVDPKVVDLAETVAPDDIRILSPHEMQHFRMAVERPF